MTLRKILGITVVITAVILVTLMFVPTNEFFVIRSNTHAEFPSPIMVYENSDDMLMGLKIIPVGCNTIDTGITESEFQISNISDHDYEVKVGMSFTENDVVLYKKEINLTVIAGQTIHRSYLSDKTYDNPICIVQIKKWSKI